MTKRFVLLAMLLLLVGFVTRAFAQAVVVDTAPITRAGAIALLVESHPQMKQRLEKVSEHLPPMPLFHDTDYTQWYAPYIEVGFEYGLITGNASRTFRPGDAITDDESIILIARFKALADPVVGMQLSFMQPEYGASLNDAAMYSLRNGVKLPFPVRLGYPVKRGDFFTMMETMGIPNARQVAITYQPAPQIVVASYHQPITAQVTQPVVPVRPVQQVPVRPPVQQPAPYYVPPVQQPVPKQPAQAAPPANYFAMSMPSIGIKDLRITHPSSLTSEGLLAPLNAGVGHLFSYPGKGGKILVYGHSSDFAWKANHYAKIFRQINKLQVGDKIYVAYGGKVHTYQVSYKQTVLATDMSVYQKPGSEELILYTCWPPDSIKERYLVHATPIAEVAQR